MEQISLQQLVAALLLVCADTLTKDGSGLEKNLRTSPKSVEKHHLASFPSCLLTSQFTDRQYLRHDSVSCELEAQPGPRASLLTGAFSWKQT